MTDESHRTEPIPEPTPGDERDNVLEGAGDFTSGEGLVAFAGMVVIASWIIFSIMAREYFFEFSILLLALAAAILPRVDRATLERVHPLPVLMKTLGYAIAILGVFTLFEDVRFGILDEVWAVIGGLITYAAAVMAFIGARQIEI